MHLTLSITIERPVPEVFAYVSDFTNVLEWLPAAVERRQVTKGPIGVGTRFEATDRVGGRRIEYIHEIVGFERDRLVNTTLSAPWNGAHDLWFGRVEAGTEMTADVSLRPTGLLHILNMLPTALARRQFASDYGRLKERLERG